MIPEEEADNFNIFLDCLSVAVVTALTPDHAKKRSKNRAGKERKNDIKPVVELSDQGTSASENDAAELSEFVQYLAEELFTSLPPSLRNLSYATTQNDPASAAQYSIPLSPSLLTSITLSLAPTVVDSLETYNITTSDETSNSLDRFLERILNPYISTTTFAPPAYTPSLTASRPSSCEICSRDYLPLTYHHLIPRQVHDKAVKRGWCAAWEVQKVAWLCRACHSFVHSVCGNEELAREWASVEALRSREDVARFAKWVGGVRWKAR